MYVDLIGRVCALFYFFSICLVVATLAQLVAADRSTLERIKVNYA